MHRKREEMMREIETADPERSLCHSHSSELCNNAAIVEGEILSEFHSPSYLSFSFESIFSVL